MQHASVSVKAALRQGLLIVGAGARIAPCVRIVPEEDDGSGGIVSVKANAVIRAGAVLCSNVEIGAGTLIGHNAVIRARTLIGDSSIISHMVCVERDSRIGHNVRISALTHITGDTLVEDHVQIGARVVTVNDHDMQWRASPRMVPPTFRRGCRIGSGASIMSGVEVGSGALVGMGAVVLKDVPPGMVVYGNPARAPRP